MFASAHQLKLYLILNILNMQSAARGHPSLEGSDHLRSQIGHGLVDTTTGSRRAAFHSEEGLSNGNRDLAVFKGHHGAIAFNHAQLTRGSR